MLIYLFCDGKTEDNLGQVRADNLCRRSLLNVFWWINHWHCLNCRPIIIQEIIKIISFPTILFTIWQFCQLKLQKCQTQTTHIKYLFAKNLQTTEFFNRQSLILTDWLLRVSNFFFFRCSIFLMRMAMATSALRSSSTWWLSSSRLVMSSNVLNKYRIVG